MNNNQTATETKQDNPCKNCQNYDPVNACCRSCGNYPDHYPDCRSWCNIFPID